MCGSPTVGSETPWIFYQSAAFCLGLVDTPLLLRRVSDLIQSLRCGEATTASGTEPLLFPDFLSGWSNGWPFDSRSSIAQVKMSNGENIVYGSSGLFSGAQSFGAPGKVSYGSSQVQQFGGAPDNDHVQLLQKQMGIPVHTTTFRLKHIRGQVVAFWYADHLKF